jgi:hypothetical protein
MSSDQPPAGEGRLRLTVQSTLLGRAKWGVRARVDGEPVPVHHGENVITLPAGRHRVEGFMIFTGEYGHASVEVDVPTGSHVAAYYAPPFMLAIPGRMGLTPQQPAGRWWVYLFVAILVLGLAFTFVR